MFRFFGIFIVIFTAYIASDVIEAKAARCPSNAVKAGQQFWPDGSIRKGAIKTRKHSCGKRLRCIGAQGIGKRFYRKCRWLG